MQASAENIWCSAQEILRSRLNQDLFQLWFAPLQPAGLDGDHFTLEVADEFSAHWLKDNYFDVIR